MMRQTSENHWPQYPTPLDALQDTTSKWPDERLTNAQNRCAQLDGNLPRTVRSIGVVAIDDLEPPEDIVIPRLYGQQSTKPGSLGALLNVNYEGDQPSRHTWEIVDRLQSLLREHPQLPAAISVVGYPQERRLDRVKSDAWDTMAAWALRNEIKHRIIGISNDADATDMPPDYTNVMRHAPYAKQDGVVWGTPITFEYPGNDPDLPMSRLLDYLNEGKALFGQFTQGPASYGGSMALALDAYAIAGDWTYAKFPPRPYGIGGPFNLIRNVWHALTGESEPAEDEIIRGRCFKQVNSHVQVSPRREVYAFVKYLGEPGRMADVLTTAKDNPVRQLSKRDIAKLAASVRIENPLFKAHLDALDAGWLGLVPPEAVVPAQKILQRARRRLGLPPATFEG